MKRTFDSSRKESRVIPWLFSHSWEQRKLASIASMHARIGWQNLRKSEFLDNGDYYLITGTDFVDGRVDLSTCHFVDRTRYEQDRNIQITNGSILITKDGTLGKVAFVRGLDKPATLNAGVFNVKITDLNVDGKYLFQYLKAPFLMDYVDQMATGGTIKHLNQNILVDFPVILPEYEEQRKIGNYFEALDDLITLHQRSTILYSPIFSIQLTQKQSAWEQRELGKAFDMTIPNNTLSRAELNYEHGEIRSVHYGDVLIKYGAYLDAQDDEIPYITDGTLSQYKGHLLQDGDIIFADTAEDETTGKAAEIGNIGINSVVSGLHTIVCRPIEKKAKYYLGYYLNSDAFHHQLLPLMQGIKVLSLSRSNLAKTTIMYPQKEEEQSQIGLFFHSLDNLITLHQREYKIKPKGDKYANHNTRDKPISRILRSMDRCL